VRFHNGVEFDAGTAKFSLDRALAPDSAESTEIALAGDPVRRGVDAGTLKIALSRRSGGLLQSLAWGAFVMVEPRSVRTTRESGRHRALSFPRLAPRRLAQPGAQRRLLGRRPLLKQATFKFISDPSAAYAALMAGDVDAFSNYPAPESFAQFAADRRFKVFVGSTDSKTILALNNRRPPLDDVSVRRAIAHALDRHAIIDGAVFGYGMPIGSHFPPHGPDYVDLTGVYPHDPALAKSLLAEAGYPEGFAVTLKLPPPSYARRAGEIIASELAEVGIRARIENLEWAQWLDQVYTRHDFDMSIVAHVEPMDYDIYARDDYYFGYSNPEFKALIAALDDSIDPRGAGICCRGFSASSPKMRSTAFCFKSLGSPCGMLMCTASISTICWA
jgi:peptide/nickel transport system substrate-binding protein